MVCVYVGLATEARILAEVLRFVQDDKRTMMALKYKGRAERAPSVQLRTESYFAHRPLRNS